MCAKGLHLHSHLVFACIGVSLSGLSGQRQATCFPLFPVFVLSYANQLLHLQYDEMRVISIFLGKKAAYLTECPIIP